MGSGGNRLDFFPFNFFFLKIFFLLLCENAQQMRYVITKLGNEK